MESSTNGPTWVLSASRDSGIIRNTKGTQTCCLHGLFLHGSSSFLRTDKRKSVALGTRHFCMWGGGERYTELVIILHFCNRLMPQSQAPHGVLQIRVGNRVVRVCKVSPQFLSSKFDLKNETFLCWAILLLIIITQFMILPEGIGSWSNSWNWIRIEQFPGMADERCPPPWRWWSSMWCTWLWCIELMDYDSPNDSMPAAASLFGVMVQRLVTWIWIMHFYCQSCWLLSRARTLISISSSRENNAAQYVPNLRLSKHKVGQ
jgi:hypothetical protein